MIKKRLNVLLFLFGISYIRNVNLRIVDGTREARSIDNDMAIDVVGQDNELILAFNGNNGFSTLRNDVEEQDDDIDEDVNNDPCLSEPDLPECKEDENEDDRGDEKKDNRKYNLVSNSI